jgi:hypothetical protein
MYMLLSGTVPSGPWDVAFTHLLPSILQWHEGGKGEVAGDSAFLSFHQPAWQLPGRTLKTRLRSDRIIHRKALLALN